MKKQDTGNKKDGNKHSDFFVQTIMAECDKIIKEQNIPYEAAESIVTKTISVTEEFSRPLMQLYKDIADRYPTIFNNITAELFLKVIKHLRKIANQRLEKRNIGVNIVIFFQQEFGNYTEYLIRANSPHEEECVDESSIFNGDINGMQKVYKCVDPQNAFFAYTFDINSNILQYQKVYSFSNGTHSMEEICGDNAIGFSILDGLPFIRIYFEGNIIADYFMSEVTGDWNVRFLTDISETIQNQCGHLLNKNSIRLIAEIAMQLAYYGIGSTLLITQSSEWSSSAPCSITHYPLQNAKRENHIYNCAKYDGAVIIQAKNNKSADVNNFGVILNTNSSIVLTDEYDILLEQTNSGTRHKKAVEYAHEHPEDCLIVISENRTISVIHGPKPIYWRDNPNPLEMINHLRNKKNKGGKKK